MSFFNKIQKLYENKSYSEKYGGSILISATIIGVILFFVGRSYVEVKSVELKQDWDHVKCNPLYMPFVGIINPPTDGTSKFSYTSKNFESCLTIILKKVVASATAPIHYATSLIMNMLKDMEKAVNAVRHMLNYIRNKIMVFIKEIMDRLLNALIPILSFISHIKTLFHKVTGVLTGILYLVLGVYMSLKAGIGAFIDILIIFLVMFAAIIIIMWIMPWTWVTAAVMTAFFISLSIPAAIVLYWVTKIYGMTSANAIPPNPCFDKYTIIETINKTKYIQDICVGDKLKDGSLVTAIFKNNIGQAKMYKLNNIFVTGKHFVYHKNEGWIEVYKHPDSIRIWDYNEPYVYCFNTDSKRISIGNTIFLDWDDINDKDIAELKKFGNPQEIFKILDGGFSGETLIEQYDGIFLPIKDIIVNDILKNGVKVIGIVRVNGNNIDNIQKYEINKTEFIGGSNLQIIDEHLGNFSTLNVTGEKVKTPEILYHLITDTKSFQVGNIKFRDYNAAMELFYGENPEIIFSYV